MSSSSAAATSSASVKTLTFSNIFGITEDINLKVRQVPQKGTHTTWGDKKQIKVFLHSYASFSTSNFLKAATAEHWQPHAQLLSRFCRGLFWLSFGFVCSILCRVFLRHVNSYPTA